MCGWRLYPDRVCKQGSVDRAALSGNESCCCFTKYLCVVVSSFHEKRLGSRWYPKGQHETMWCLLHLQLLLSTKNQTMLFMVFSLRS
jgi:hypothetical protein